MIRRNETAAAGVMTFGQRMGQRMQATNQRDEKSAEVWLNVGYETGDPEYPFVSLPFGIPIDTQEPINLPRKEGDYRDFVTYRNKLLEDIQLMANDLKPGEEIILSMPGSEGGLVIQLRRKQSEVASSAPSSDRFAPKFQFATAAGE